MEKTRPHRGFIHWVGDTLSTALPAYLPTAHGAGNAYNGIAMNPLKNFGSRFRPVALLVPFFWAALGSAIGQPAVAGEAAARGAALYAQSCASCHGEDRSGLLHFQGSLEELRDILEGTREGMPDFYGVFVADEINDLYAYLSSDSGADNAAPAADRTD